MAIQTARYFSRIDCLKAISPKCLIQFLSPYTEFLSSKGFNLKNGARTGRFDCSALTRLLMTSDCGTSNKLVNSLHCICEVARSRAMDRLLEEAAMLGISLDDPGLSPADLAVLVMLRDSRVFERIYAEQFLVKPRTLVYFQGSRSKVMFVEPSMCTIRALEQDLNHWFESMQQGSGCRVYVYHRKDGIWFMVWHGAHYRREGCIEHGESSCICYRPERYDVLIYQPGTDELQINAGTRGEREVYRKLFGRHLFLDDNHFPGTSKYTLDPLQINKEKVLVCSDVPGMEYVKLYRLEFCIDGPLRSIETVEAEDVFAAIAADDIVISSRARFSEAWFSIKFTDSKSPRSVSIRPSNMIHYQRESDCKAVDLWLRLRGFVLGSRLILPLLIFHMLFGLDALLGSDIAELCSSCGVI